VIPRLGKSIIIVAACILFSDSHDIMVECIGNYSAKPYTFRADNFLGMAEPVAIVQGTGKEVVDSCLANNSDNSTVCACGWIHGARVVRACWTM